jgi:hypothetical protein
MLEIGTYNRNALRGNVYFFVDGHGFMLVDKENLGTGDCIGRNLEAYIAYGDDMFVKAVANQWHYTEKGMIGYRHPTNHYKMSPDHFINTLSIFKLYLDRGGDNPMIKQKFKDIIASTPRGIEERMRFNRAVVNWARAMGGDRGAELKYYLIEIGYCLTYLPLHWLGYKIAGFGGEVEQEDWVKIQLQSEPKWKRWIDKAVYPSFAIHNACKQMESLGDNNFPRIRKLLKRMFRPMVGKTNYVQKLYLDMKVPEERIASYKAMRGGRWTGYLHIRNDRNMELMPDTYAKANQLDVDYARAIWNKKRG